MERSMKYSIGDYIEALKIVFAVMIVVDNDDDSGDICMCWLKTNSTSGTLTALIRIQKPWNKYAGSCCKLFGMIISAVSSVPVLAFESTSAAVAMVSNCEDSFSY